MEYGQNMNRMQTQIPNKAKKMYCYLQLEKAKKCRKISGNNKCTYRETNKLLKRNN